MSFLDPGLGNGQRVISVTLKTNGSTIDLPEKRMTAGSTDVTLDLERFGLHLDHPTLRSPVSSEEGEAGRLHVTYHHLSGYISLLFRSSGLRPFEMQDGQSGFSFSR